MALSDQVVGEDCAEFRSTELECVIGNNAAAGEHREGYNGLFRLTSTHQPETLFVPFYAGLNLELFFDGASIGRDRDRLFEPRHAPMEFRKLDDRTAELYQPPTPLWKVENWTHFRLVDPYYIDVTFRCVPHEYLFQGGALGVFWASYINEPLNKSIYFLQGGSSLEEPRWHQFCPQYHGHDSTVKHESDPFQWDFMPEVTKTFMFAEISRITYAEPFYYGRFRNMVWIIMFEKPENVRFTQSPSGGGKTRAGDDTCPAWDFQFVVPDYEVGKEYQLRYCVAYKPWRGRSDVLNEVRLLRERLKN
ncbi:MAG: hypothetical protein ABIH23_12405, partial [bacterium]